MEYMDIYNAVRSCPGEALKPIQAGKLKGKSDINPMWRIKTLTSLFGPCGIGWKTVDETFWTEPGAGGEVIAWCSLKLLWWEKEAGAWSDPVFGIGGAMMVDTQKGSLVTNDDAYKMAYTDAISVACKALGFAADVYWQNDRTKYDAHTTSDPAHVCERCNKAIQSMRGGDKLYSADEIAANSIKAYGYKMCWSCMKHVKAQMEAGVTNENAG